MHSEYDLVRIDEDQYEQFAKLVEASFGAKSAISDVERLFATEAFGPKHIGFIAYQAGEAAAFYGVFPCRVELDGVTYLAAQSGSTMTHPDHRKKGLFVETGKRTFELAREEGIRFAFGFPRDTSYPGLIKLGWSTNGRFNVYDFFVPTLPLAAIGSRMGSDDAAQARFLKAFGSYRISTYDPPANSVIEPRVGGVSRDEDLITYKGEAANRFVVEIDGAKVWIAMHRGVLGIGDIGPVESAEQINGVIKNLKAICFRAGIVRMVTYLSPEGRLDRALREGGYKSRTGLPICHLDLGSGLPLDDFKYVYGDFDTF